MGKVVLVGGQKGGTGKSTLATNLAAYRLSKKDHNNILLVDTDLQGSTANWTYFRRQNDLDGIECIQLFGKQIKSEIDSKKNTTVILLSMPADEILKNCGMLC